MAKKVGRNDPCPCGSGNKFKRCHGSHKTIPSLDPRSVRQKFREMQAEEARRVRFQGHGKPIDSSVVNGRRFVAVGSEIYVSEPGKWGTFHDFLVHYLRSELGGEWANEELRKDRSLRHPLLNWYQDLAAQLTQIVPAQGVIGTGPATGASSAFLFLAYDLYLIGHNVADRSFQSRLFQRLKNKDHFLPAVYEIHVAAAMIQAAFDIAFENEDDVNRTHCEFTATFRATAKSFSVEAKMRQPGKLHSAVRNQLYAALKKQADHERIVFIELNVPDVLDADGQPAQIDEVLQSIHSAESMTIEGNPAPPTYIAITNFPHHYSPDAPIRRWGLFEGFKIQDFKFRAPHSTFREARLARDRHIEVNLLQKSLQMHSWIPMTFSGETPEVEFSNLQRPLIVGRVYPIDAPEGSKIDAELLYGCVFEGKQEATCLFRTAEGKNVVVNRALTDDEFAIYKADPQTFFGGDATGPSADRLKDPLEIYDWLYESYRHNSKEHFLDELLKDARDIEELRGLSQTQLLEIFCERTVESIVRGGAAN